MAPPRPYWKGYLKLSLVSCPIAVYPATSTSERVAFKQINKQTGNRLRQQLVDEDTGEVVEAPDKGRGYEVSKHEYMMVEDDELEAIAIESSQTIEIDSFVPRAQIDADRKIVDLMEALKRSLAITPKPAESIKPTGGKKAAAKAPGKRTGQGEMLLPIEGTKAAATLAAVKTKPSSRKAS